MVTHLSFHRTENCKAGSVAGGTSIPDAHPVRLFPHDRGFFGSFTKNPADASDNNLKQSPLPLE
jgi:hypothetical protein